MRSLFMRSLVGVLFVGFGASAWASDVPDYVENDQTPEDALFHEDLPAPDEGQLDLMKVLVKQLPESCKQLNLTDDQKAQIHTAKAAARSQKRALRAELREARAEFKVLLADPKTDYAAAKVTADKFSAVIGKMIASKVDLKTNILFNVMTPEQREPAMQCFKDMRKAKFMRRVARICKAMN